MRNRFSCCLAAISFVALVASPAWSQPELGFSAEPLVSTGALVKINGAVSNAWTSMLIDWDDGTRETTMFPAVHYYSRPGGYEIAMTAWDAAGRTTTRSVTHNVSAAPPSIIASVQISPEAVGFVMGSEVRVSVRAYDNLHSEVQLDGHRIEAVGLQNIYPEWLDVSISGPTIVVRAKPGTLFDARQGTVFIFVDGRPAPKPVYVIANRNTATDTLITGQSTVLHLPSSIISAFAISPSEATKVLDCAVGLYVESIQSQWPSSVVRFQGFSYLPSVHGVNGWPVGLGTTAFAGTPALQWIGISLHEMGHKFHDVPSLLPPLGWPGAFYLETLAEWYVQYALNGILDAHKAELQPVTVNRLVELRDSGLAYHRQESQNYINRGKVFDFDNTAGGSHPLVHLIYTYSARYGWDRLPKFLRVFGADQIDSVARILDRNGGINTANRVTVFAAALAATFPEDCAKDFADLNFPLNRSLYTELVSLWTVRPRIDAIVNGASFVPDVSASAWASIFGANLASTTRLWRNDEIINGKLPNQLDGISVEVNGKAAAINYISSTQLNVQIPADDRVGSVDVKVTNSGGTAIAIGKVRRFAPGLFTFDGKYLASQHADYSYVANPSLLTGVPSSPARPGEVVILYGTGFGPTAPSLPSGEVITAPAPLANSVNIWIGNRLADVQWKGMSGAGLWQFNVAIPNDLPDGDASVVAEVGGVRTQANALISIQR